MRAPHFGKRFAIAVRAKDPIVVHEKVPIVPVERGVMHIVVFGRANSEQFEQWIPRMRKFAVDERKL